MEQSSHEHKTPEDSEFDDLSDIIELAELAASAHSIQDGQSPLELAQFLMKLDRAYFSEVKNKPKKSKSDDPVFGLLDVF